MLGLTVEDQARLLVEQLTGQARQASFAELARLARKTAEPLLTAEPALQKAFVEECLRAGSLAGRDWLQLQALKLAAGPILRGRRAWQDHELADLIHLCGGIPYEASPVSAVLKLAEARPVSSLLARALDKLRAALEPWRGHGEAARLLRRIEACLAHAPVELSAEGPWTERVYAELAALPGGDAWVRVFRHARLLPPTEPSWNWRQTAAALVQEIGADPFRNAVERWLRWGPAAGRSRVQVSPGEARVFRGLLWFLPACAGGGLCAAIADFAEQCLRKAPPLGALSPRTGCACIQVLAAIPGPEALAELARLARRLRSREARNLAGEALAAAALAAGIDPAELDELTLPTFGLDAAGSLREELGDVTAEVRIAGASVSATWTDGSGNRSKSMPARLRDSHPEEVRELRGTMQTLDSLLAAQRARLERLMRNGRQIPFERWLSCYLEHPLVSRFAARLIWEFGVEDRTRTAIWRDGQLWDPNGGPVEPGLPVRLWHPLRSGQRTVLAWRRWLEAQRVTQPFPQAHRDVYRMTPAEGEDGAVSRRFAGHILRPYALAKHCRNRGWQFDSGRLPHRSPVAWLDLPEWNLRAELRLTAVTHDAGPRAEEPLLRTGELRFFFRPAWGKDIRPPANRGRVTFRAEPSSGAEQREAPLAEVPPVVFSEVLRDLDLLAAEASLGADPEYGLLPEAPFASYWRKWAFGELAESGRSRRELLARLVPSLAIASRCRIDDPFLIVSGERGAYRIHVGSGHVLAEPGNRYVCVAPHGSPPEFYVPYEGDHTLTAILNRAFALAGGRGIKDRHLLRFPAMP